MNVAPLLLAEAKGWTLPDQFYQRFADFNPVISRDAKSRAEELVIQPLPIDRGVEIAIGLLSMTLIEWNLLLEPAKEIPASPSQGASLICGVKDRWKNRVLIFPDDLNDDYNFSIFAPTLSSSGGLILNILRFDVMDWLNGRWKPKLNPHMGCVVKIERTKVRRASCKNVGCRKACGEPIKKTTYGSVPTLYCEC